MLNFSTRRRTNVAFFSTTWVLPTGRVNFGNQANGEKYNITDVSLLKEFLENNDAHVILTAEANSSSTGAKELLEDYGLVGCHSKRGNYLSVRARIDSTGCVRLRWGSNEDEDKGSHAAIFEVKLEKNGRIIH